MVEAVFVIPLKNGIQRDGKAVAFINARSARIWIPACAGMTAGEVKHG